jgi:hypothetical protein
MDETAVLNEAAPHGKPGDLAIIHLPDDRWRLVKLAAPADGSEGMVIGESFLLEGKELDDVRALIEVVERCR